jgi:hypothetical protein
MKVITREIISGGLAAAAFGGTVVTQSLPMIGCAVAGGLVYAGLRLMLPGDSNPSGPADPPMFVDSRASLQRLKLLTGRLDNGDFRAEVEGLVTTLSILLDRAQKDQNVASIDPQFPRSIERLCDLLNRYRDLTHSPKRSESLQAALSHTEDVLKRTREHFDRLLEQEVDDDAIRLKVDARVYEELTGLPQKYRKLGSS